MSISGWKSFSHPVSEAYSQTEFEDRGIRADKKIEAYPATAPTLWIRRAGFQDLFGVPVPLVLDGLSGSAWNPGTTMAEIVFQVQRVIAWCRWLVDIHNEAAEVKQKQREQCSPERPTAKGMNADEL